MHAIMRVCVYIWLVGSWHYLHCGSLSRLLGRPPHLHFFAFAIQVTTIYLYRVEGDSETYEETYEEDLRRVTYGAR